MGFTKDGKRSANWTCPYCSKVMPSRGKAGHLFAIHHNTYVNNRKYSADLTPVIENEGVKITPVIHNEDILITPVISEKNIVSRVISYEEDKISRVISYENRVFDPSAGLFKPIKIRCYRCDETVDISSIDARTYNKIVGRIVCETCINNYYIGGDIVYEIISNRFDNNGRRLFDRVYDA